ncbi:hypothetical protein BH23CHL8_BH23CHL8_03380 [soil metagenome]
MSGTDMARDLEVAVPSAAGWPAKRILVLIDDRRPTLWQFASDRRGQLPLLFDFLR